jgi:hypothetical protein
MNGAKNVIIEYDVVVSHIFRRLGEGFDRTSITAKFDLRINHANPHAPLPSSYDDLPLIVANTLENNNCLAGSLTETIDTHWSARLALQA